MTSGTYCDTRQFQVLDRQHVAIAHHQIDVVQRDAFRRETVVDHLLIKTGVVLLARDPFLVDRERNLTVAKETRAHIVVVRIDPKDVSVLARHSCSAEGASKLTLLGSPVGKNAYFRLRQQARAPGPTTLRWRKRPARRRSVAYALFPHAAFAPCAPHACEPQARVSLM